MATKSPHSHTHTRSTAFLQSPPRRNRHPRNHPVIPAKAGTQTPVSITTQPVIALKPPHCDPPTRPTAFLQSPPRRNRHPRNHPVIPAKAGTQTPVSRPPSPKRGQQPFCHPRHAEIVILATIPSSPRKRGPRPPSPTNQSWPRNHPTLIHTRGQQPFCHPRHAETVIPATISSSPRKRGPRPPYP